VRADDLIRLPVGAAGAHVERLFANQDLLRSLAGDSELLALRVAAAPKTMLVERREPSGALERARLVVEEGLPLPGRIPEALLRLVPALDGRRTLGEALVLAELGPECVPVVRELLARGLLVATR
jgi:hypothetical protein